jgi:hypothetical protein
MNEQPEKKIIIDEDWKTQVQRERAEMRDKKDEEVGEPGEVELAPSTDAGSEASETMAFDPGEMPTASIHMLVTTLATQALAAMGQIPDPLSGEAQVSLPFAKYQIDLLAVLKEKTSGNLDTEENAILEGAIHQLRMVYIELESRQ